MKKFRVGFLIDDFNLESNVLDLIKFVKESKNFDKPVIITGYKKYYNLNIFERIKKNLKKTPLKLINDIIRVITLKIIYKLESKNVNDEYPGFFLKKKFIEKDLFDTVMLSGRWSKSGLYLEFTNEDLDKLSSYNLDCIIRCGSGILRGNILDCFKYGVLSFHHGDNRVNRGAPTGFWEVMNNEPSSGFIIQKLGKELDGGEVLLRGNLNTKKYWLLNQAQLLKKSNFFLIKLLNDLAIKRVLPKTEGVTLHGNKLFKSDNAKDYLKYLFTILLPGKLKSFFKSIFNSNKICWQIAFANHNNFSKSLWKYNEIKNPVGRFLADPFVIEHNGENYIFVEDFLFNDLKGRISVIKITKNSYDFLGIALEEKFHLSFPFIFKNEKDIFMIPESNENKDIRLYKCLEFPLKWKLEKILMSNVSASDTMVFKKKDVWFMLTNICSSQCGDNSSELHIFYADNFNSQFWYPIKSGNPVIFDSRKARNGGFCIQDEVLYRINQKHIPGVYGKSFNLNKVIELSKERYLEQEICTINPNFKKNIISTHHFHANKFFAVVDFAREEKIKINFK